MKSFFIFTFFIVLFTSENFSGFVVLLYKAVDELLPVPDFKTLVFFKSLLMLRTFFIFESQSYKRRNCLIKSITLFFVSFNKHRIIFI